jgi:hypothetical protein
VLNIDSPPLSVLVNIPTIVQKVLRTLPSRFDPKISAIEEMKDLDSLTMDELHGILTTYEMRTVQENPSKHEVTFKASKGTSSKGHQTYDSSEEESDAEEENFVRRLKKGTGKYKGKLPFKCFDCGKVGHFSTKFPYKRDSNFRKNKYHYISDKNEEKRKNYKKKKNMYAHDEGSSSDEEDNNTKDVLFMAINELSDETSNHEDPDEEGEVNLEGELICALNELEKLRKKNESLKEQLRKSKGECHEPNSETKTIGLKRQLEETKRIEEILATKLKEMEDIFHQRELEIVFLRK